MASSGSQFLEPRIHSPKALGMVIKEQSPVVDHISGASRLTMETSYDNRELANALLSLGSKHIFQDPLEQTYKDADTFRKAGFLPLPSTPITTFDVSTQPSASLSYSNGWVGGSSLIGYPYSSYPMPICSCIPRVSPEYPAWKTYQQNTASNIATVNSNSYQSDRFRYPQPLHHPLLFAQNALQPNFTNFNDIESKTFIPRTLRHEEPFPFALQQQQQQQHQQQIIAANQTKFSPEVTSHSLKKDSVNDASVAVVAPVFIEFSQKNKVSGIPLICNVSHVSQWLNLPPFERDRMMSANMKPMYGATDGQQHNCKSNNNNADDVSLETLMNFKSRKDPISQLGEAANMILQCEETKGMDAKSQLYENGLKRMDFQDCYPSISMSRQTFIPPSNVVNSSRDGITSRSFEVMSGVKLPAPKNLKNRTCPYCQKIFARPFTLKSHIRRHTKEKPFTCIVCQRSFSQSATLENHKLTHTGVKPHQCHLCLKRFAHQTSLKTHLRIHSGEQPYKCEFCARRFTDGSTLQKHKRTHSGDKPFRCQRCLKCFSQSGNMKRHMATTHKQDSSSNVFESGKAGDVCTDTIK